MNTAVDALVEEAKIVRLLQDWALWRDVGNWENLRGAYAPGAIMKTTWFDGLASDFVDASIRMSAGKARAQHFIGASSVRLSGERATAETRIILLVRAPLGEVEVDATCFGRFYDHLIKRDGRWLIQRRVPIYEKDHIKPVDPAAKIELDHAELGRFPDPYKHLAYLQSRGGATITLDLPLPGSAAQAALYAGGEAWLRS